MIAESAIVIADSAVHENRSCWQRNTWSSSLRILDHDRRGNYGHNASEYARTGQISELTKIINHKMTQFGVKIDAHRRFGAAVKRETEAWREMTRLNQETLRSLDALFDPNNPTEEVFDYPEEDYEPFAIR